MQTFQTKFLIPFISYSVELIFFSILKLKQTKLTIEILHLESKEEKKNQKSPSGNFVRIRWELYNSNLLHFCVLITFSGKLFYFIFQKWIENNVKRGCDTWKLAKLNFRVGIIYLLSWWREVNYILGWVLNLFLMKE